MSGSIPQQICTRCVLPSSFPRIRFDEKGICSVCREYDQWWGNWSSKKSEQGRIIERICREARSKHREFDALVPLSGGKDSTYVLYIAQKELGLKCLAYTLDTGYLSDHARNNVERTCRKLGVEHLYYCMDVETINRLFALFMKKTGWFCSVCMRAIQMSTFRIAEIFRVPLIIKGSSLRTELPLAREMYQGGDPAHVRRVLDGEPIAHDCQRLVSRGTSKRRILGFMLFLLSGQKSLTSYAYLNLADYWDWDYDIIHSTIRKELSWTAPTESEHMDCIIHPIQKYIHNRRFPSADMRRLTLARLVMARLMTREDALRKLEEEPGEQCPEAVMKLFLKNVNMTREEFDKYVDMGPRHLQYHPQPSFALRLAQKVFPTFKETLFPGTY